jgi:hypothetical protein
MRCLDLSRSVAPENKIVDLEVPRSKRGGGTIKINGLVQIVHPRILGWIRRGMHGLARQRRPSLWRWLWCATTPLAGRGAKRASRWGGAWDRIAGVRCFGVAPCGRATKGMLRVTQ